MHRFIQLRKTAHRASSWARQTGVMKMGCGVQVWLQVGQLFGTLAIGGVAGVIAWRQWRTAQDKVKLDLFDRRFAVFMDARRLVSEAVALGKITDQNLPNEVIARGRFLFGDEVLAKLGELHGLCTRLLTNDHHAPSQMSTWLDEFHDMMRPYMSLGNLKT
ncbi:hypothetical protein [Agrobacterium tumefaciens]|nr:hypothetical protein [Agrobacterium tumefaciens]